jgi:predicted metal-dependent phosphoesterase TrpH
MIDLHTHSTFSDGSDTPSELAAKAHKLGLHAISLTDHDSTRSFTEMDVATTEYGIELVPGVEVSLRDNEFPMRRGEREVPRNVHVLAYFLPMTPAHPLQQQLASLRHDRDVRNLELVSLLQEKGFERLTLEYLTTISGNVHSIGRPHFARAMFELASRDCRRTHRRAMEPTLHRLAGLVRLRLHPQDVDAHRAVRGGGQGLVHRVFDRPPRS